MVEGRSVALATLLAVLGISAVFLLIWAALPLVLAAPVFSGTVLVVGSVTALIWLVQRDKTSFGRRERRRERAREYASPHLF